MLNKIFDEFNTTYEVKPIAHTKEELLKVLELIQSEVDELKEEIEADRIDVTGVAAELADCVYITGERATALGFDIDALVLEKHRSNMSKVLPVDMTQEMIREEYRIAKQRYPAVYLAPVHNGFVLKCGDTSKVCKPICYSKAVITREMVGL